MFVVSYFESENMFGVIYIYVYLIGKRICIYILSLFIFLVTLCIFIVLRYCAILLDYIELRRMGPRGNKMYLSVNWRFVEDNCIVEVMFVCLAGRE